MQIYHDNSNSLIDLIEKIESFTLIKNGKHSFLDASSQNFIEMKDNLLEVFKQGTLMPALSVSLHNLTVEEMKSGNWLELNFKDEQIKNDLPFTSLLIKLEQTGDFNLIRKHNEKYDGRCLYLQLENHTDLNLLVFWHKKKELLI